MSFWFDPFPLFPRIVFEEILHSSSKPQFWTPKADIKTTDKELIICLELPGVQKDQLNVEVIQGRFLRVTGEKKDDYEKKSDSEKRYVERVYGKFSRTFSLPKNVRVDDIRATFENGVLRVTVPLPHEVAKDTKKIEIRKLMARISSLERMVKLLVYYLSTQENDGKNRSREVRNKNYEEDSLDGDMDTNLTFEQLKQLISTLRQDNLCSVEDKNKAVDSLLETKRSPAGDTSATSHQHNPKDSNAPSSSLRPTDRLRPPSQSNSAQSSPVSHRRKVSTEWSQSTNVSTTESDKKRSHVFTSQSESHRSKQRGVPHEENIVVVPSVPNTLSPTSNHNSSTFPSNVNSNLFSKIVLLTNTQLNALIHSEFNEVLQLENGVHSLGRSNGSRFKLGTDKRDKHSDITPLLTAAEIQNKIIGIMKENSTLYEKYCYWIDRLVQQQKTLRRGSISSVSLPTTSSTRALPYDGIVTLNVIVHDSRGNAIHTTKCACVPLNSTVRSFQNKISKQIPAIDSEKWGLVLTSTGILLQAHRTFNSYLLRKEEEVIFQKVSKKLCRVVVIENNGAASTPEVSEVDVIPTKTTLFGIFVPSRRRSTAYYRP
jgi:HSP20 family protein